MIFNKAGFKFFWLLVTMVFAVLLSLNFKIETSILKLLPKYESERTNAMISKATEMVNKQLILMATADNKEKLIIKFNNALQGIENKPFIANLRDRISPETIEGVYQALADSHMNLLSVQDRMAFEYEMEFEYFVLQAQESLYGLQQINPSQLSVDPLFLFNRLMQSMAGLKVMEFDANEMHFMVQQNNLYHMAAFIELEDSAFSPENQTAVINALEGIKTTLNNDQIQLYSFGAVRYAHQAYQDAKHEISSVGLGSLLGIIFLIVVVFRSTLPLLLSLTCIGLGLIVSLSIAQLVFGQIHVFALVFGATIAGVSIDYCFHYLIEAGYSQTLSSAEKPRFSVAQILPGLVIGFFSSALVYLGFLVTGYAVLAQISLISVLGLMSVLINVLVFFPWLYRPKALKQIKHLQKIGFVLLNNPIQSLFRKPWLPIILLLISAIFSYRYITPNDDVRALQQLSPELKQEEAMIRNVLSWPNNEYFVLISAQSVDDLLRQEANVLNTLRLQNESLVGVSDFIPDSETQKINYQRQVSLFSSNEVQAYLQQLEIVSPVIEPFMPLAGEVLNQEPFQTLFQQRWLGEVNGEHILIIPVSKSVELPKDSTVILIQQATDTSDLFAQFREKSTLMLACAVAFLWMILALFRYTALEALHLVSIPLVAGFVSLCMAWWVGLHLSLFSVLALLLILGMGLDYVVFLKESRHPHRVIIALLLSSLTTILAFGLLSFSQVAVLKSFGFMVGIGIALVLLIAPAVVTKKLKE